jgi:hypothetical protein
MADAAHINGRYVSWASIKISLNSVDYSDIVALDYSDKLEPGAVRGTGPRKRGRTTGEYDCEGKITMHLDEARTFMRALANVNPSIGLVEFPVIAYWSEEDGQEPHEVICEGCRIKSRESSNVPGSDAAAINFALDMMNVTVDGVSLLVPA